MDNGLFYRQAKNCRHISMRRPVNRQLAYYKTDNDDDDDDDDVILFSVEFQRLQWLDFVG